MQIVNVSGYKFLRFGGNPQKYLTLVPAKNSHLKVYVEVKRRMQAGLRNRYQSRHYLALL